MNLVIDSCVFINYGLYNKLYRLTDAIIKYELKVFVDNDLLLEIERNLNKSKIRSIEEINKTMNFILPFVIKIETTPIFTNSPDPRDNFLFDIAIQTNSEVIVTQEKALLNFSESPVPIHDIKWFKESFPVPL